MASPSPRRVLIVDDHVDTTDVLARLLTRRGLLVTIAHTLAQARQHCAESTFDTILCDIQLPDGDGTDLASELKSARAPTRLIALTAHGMPEQVQTFTTAGFDACLLKPVHLETVFAALAQAHHPTAMSNAE
jgi:CheY-like chemotaxis protein